ncbi:unnamed protein product [Acanthoscelides obtectus]|uniref:Uncharacterized protein n=1 Tax=Acanthoscelides obtectus TaxID=200917 RepID=A0A9P0L671_ACAOB|nr:unnamed protein product [Acanthoscelides obtectus]CAK1674027.1 hypothetical protein AOBTE_LOCUS29505 [Acanthoscelides obtectus]
MINYLLEKLSKPKKYFGHAKNLRYNKVYQYYVEVILVKCIQHHQFLVSKFSRCKKLLYYPIYALFIGGVLLSTSLIYVSLQTSRTFKLAYFTPWYLWNAKNKKMLLMFLINSSSPMELCAGDLHVNMTLCASFVRLCYTLLLTIRRLDF